MKATVSDLLIIMVVGILLVFSLGIIYYVGVKLKEGTQSVFQKYGGNTTYIEKSTSAVSVFLNSIPFVMLLLGITAIVLAYQIPAHPIFAPISFFILALYVILSTFFSNIFWNIANNTILTQIFNEFPLVAWVFKYLPYVIGVIGFVIIIVQYSKVGGVE